MRRALPISPKYDSPIFEAVTIQLVLGILALLMLDGGVCARICGIALVAYWSGAAVLIWRHPQSPTRLDIGLIRFGYLMVIALTLLIDPLAVRLREFFV